MPGTLDDVNCVSPTPSSVSTAVSPVSDNLSDSREFKDYNGRMMSGGGGGGSSWSRHSRSSSALDRHSESSESLDNQSTTSSSGGGANGRQMQDFGSSEYIPTRSTKTAPKVAYNPMQFVKTGPTKLATTAQQQLKKAEEVKKIREKKKDESEDWQSNLEGWKSSRRKRQEHVIERVTEVKRMEQQEALKAAEAATKRLIGIREKRGKLSALYSVEDNDEIEFTATAGGADNQTDPSSDSVFQHADQQQDQQDSRKLAEVSEEEVNQVTTSSSPLPPPPNDPDRHPPQPNRPKEENDTVRTVAKQQYQQRTEVTSETTAKARPQPISSSPVKEELQGRKPTTAFTSGPVSSPQRTEEIPTAAAAVVVQRRSVFESSSLVSSSEDKTSVTSSLNNRRSGEFSSTFKNRLSTFEATTTASESVSSQQLRVTPDRDPDFKNKLANFHQVKSGTNPAATSVKDQPEHQDLQPERPDFKAKLAAFRQVESESAFTSSAAVVTSKSIEPTPAPLKPILKQPETIAEPVVKASKFAPPSAKDLHPPKVQMAAMATEPIYANSSAVALATASASGGGDVGIHPLPSNSGGGGGGGHGDVEGEASDCTEEDEGIRSLSPHGTPSPTLPNRMMAVPTEPVVPALPAHPPVVYSRPGGYTFQPTNSNEEDDIVSPPPPPSSSRSPPHPEEAVWNDCWVDLGVTAVAPPSEKPPPPPIPTPSTPHSDVEDLPTPGEAPSYLRISSSPTPPRIDRANAMALRQHQDQQVQMRRPVTNNDRPTTAEADLRQELRRRRSDFLGFDVNAMEDDAKELADAIPPPPDLKSLLRQSGSLTSDWQPTAQPPPPPPPVSAVNGQAEEEAALARKEREIIETLEKEERMRLTANTSFSSHDDSLNRSQDGGAGDDPVTAEIDQLAREWQNDALLGPGWRGPAKQQLHPALLHPDSTIHRSRVLAPEATSAPSSSMPTTGSLHVDVAPRKEPLPTMALTPPSSVRSDVPQQVSPPKPSRLSAAPKPKLHDGEAWMAKRKVASEGAPAAPKDVSRHWLIQEAEQRRIDAMQERHYSPSASSSSHSGLGVPGAPNWMSRSSSSTSMDKMSMELTRLNPPKDSPMPSSVSPRSVGSSSLGSSAELSSSGGGGRLPLYANQEEILEFADFTGAPHTAPPVWQVRSLVASGSMDHLQSIHLNHSGMAPPPSRPAKSQSQTLPSSSSIQHQQQQQHQYLHQQATSGLPAATHPSWRSTGHPPETEKEPIAPLPHSVIHTLTQRMTQRGNGNNNSNNNNNYGDYMNVQEVNASATAAASRAGPQVPAQKPANYRHPSVVGASHSAPLATPSGSNNNNINNGGGDRMLSVSGKKKCSLCQEELGRGAAMIIESLRLFYHIHCFRCCVCGLALGNGTAGTDVRVRNNNLHCHDCYSNDDGLKFSKV